MLQDSGLYQQIHADMKLLQFKLIDAMDAEDSPRPLLRKLKAKALVRDKRKHHPHFDLLYLVDVREPYPRKEIKDLGNILAFWRALHEKSLHGEVNFVLQTFQGSGISLFYVVRHIITEQDLEECEQYGLNLF